MPEFLLLNVREDGGGGPRAGAAGMGALGPSLTKRNNCTEGKGGETKVPVLGIGKRRFAFYLNTRTAVERWGVEKTAALVLTFAENVVDKKEAERRFHSLSTHVIEPRYGQAVKVAERQEERGRKNGDLGAVHFHLLVKCPVDIKTGYVHSKRKGRGGRGACDWLKAERAWLYRTLPRYGFGVIHRLEPLKKNAEAVGKYMAKYLAKGLENRGTWEKGARLVSYIGFQPGDKACSGQFALWTQGNWSWRWKAADFAKLHGIKDIGGFKDRFGAKWSFKLKEQILSMPEPVGSPFKAALMWEAFGNDWQAQTLDLLGKVESRPVFIEPYVHHDHLIVNPEYFDRPPWDITAENVLARENAKARGVEWVKRLPRFKPWMIEDAPGPRGTKVGRAAAEAASVAKWGD